MDQRLLGQDVTVRLVRDGVVASAITAIGSFSDSVESEIKEENFLGRVASDYTDVFSGYKGDLEFQTANAGWTDFTDAIVARQQRSDPGIVFNVVRTDLYANGDSTIYVYKDVAWGPEAATIGARKDFAKIKLSFACSERDKVTNQLL